MLRVTLPGLSYPKLRLASFTLVELLTVIAIIAILAALTLAAAGPVMNKAARSRATSEVAAMGTSLENYKADNGIYPPYSGFGSTNTYSTTDPSTIGSFYQLSGQTLYQALSGKTNYLDIPLSGVKAYMSFKANQLGNNKAAAGTTGTSSSYIQDPWGYAYGYYTGSPSSPPAANDPAPVTGAGFFDLWSTGGTTGGGTGGTETNRNVWISNWSN